MLNWLEDITVGGWYQVRPQPPFEVVAIDFDHQTIEIQYFDGTLGEVDFDAWLELGAKPAAPPEDWSGAMDMAREDYGVDLDMHHFEDWSNPLDQLDAIY